MMLQLSSALIEESKRKAAERGKNPNVVPPFSYRLTEREFKEKLDVYSEIIEVVNHFVDKYLTTASGSPLLITVTDDEGHLLALHGNEAMKGSMKQFGILEGVRYDEYNGPSSIELCLRYDCPVQLVGKDHYHRDLHQTACYSVPIRTEAANGTITLMTDVSGAHPHLLPLLCTVADYTEREILLRKQNTQLQILNQALLHTPHSGVLLTDCFGSLLEINEPMRGILDALSPDKRYGPGVPVFDIPDIGSVFREVTERAEERVGIELCLESAGISRIYMLDVVPIKESCAGGAIIRVIGTLRDVSELRQTQERLHRAEKLAFAGQLAASVAHEIRNPLTTVKGMIQLSANKGDVLHQDLILSELERMNMIVSELLLLGKPQAGQRKREFCYDIMLEVLEVFRIQASMNGVDISASMGRELPVYGDRKQIKQVYFNLLRNAMEALPYGGNIDIWLDVEGDYQQIRFCDNGVGMEEEVLARLGEPFHTTRPDGTGLGLMVVRNIVAAHNGRMNIASKPGSGTRIDIYLPVMREEAAEGRP